MVFTPASSSQSLICIGPSHASHLPPGHTTDTSADNTRQILTTHSQKGANGPTDEEHKPNTETREQPERRNNVLLLTRRPAPLRSLLSTVFVRPHISAARAHVALGAAAAGVFVRELQLTGAVARAVAGHALAGREGGEACREDAAEDGTVGVVPVGREGRGAGCGERVERRGFNGDFLLRSLVKIRVRVRGQAVGAVAGVFESLEVGGHVQDVDVVALSDVLGEALWELGNVRGGFIYAETQLVLTSATSDSTILLNVFFFHSLLECSSIHLS